MNIVIDKSFLQGSSKKEIHQMCDQYQLIMPEVLFLEILTTKNEDMVKCFNKFPIIENPVALIPNVGTLIRYETEKNRPCSPIETQFLKIRYVFNDQLSMSQFVFTDEQKESLQKWKTSAKEDTADFIKKATVADDWFPELRGYIPGQSPKPIVDAMNMIASDIEFVRKTYSQIRDDIYKTYDTLWPEPESINKKWVLFRHLQVHLLAALEYIKKYGRESQPTVTKRLENEYLDIDYCIVGTLSNGLATRDSTMAKFYNLLCPEKRLLS